MALMQPWQKEIRAYLIDFLTEMQTAYWIDTEEDLKKIAQEGWIGFTGRSYMELLDMWYECGGEMWEVAIRNGLHDVPIMEAMACREYNTHCNAV